MNLKILRCKIAAEVKSTVNYFYASSFIFDVPILDTSYYFVRHDW